MKNKTYAVMSVSVTVNERRVGGFDAKNDSEAKKKFNKWWPSGKGFLRYRLYRLIDSAQ